MKTTWDHEYCTCLRKKTEGWTHVGDQLWVHEKCGKISHMVWLKNQYWDELDSIFERMLTGQDAADGQDRGRAEQACYFIAILEHSDIVSVRNEGIRRFKRAQADSERAVETRYDTDEIHVSAEITSEISNSNASDHSHQDAKINC